MNPRTLAVCLLLFGSGFCALVYQTVWLREFRLIFGASTAATAAVLGIFMGGLGIGSWYFGRRVESASRPLGVYANLEMGIAAAAALTPFLVTLIRTLYIWLGGSLALGPVGGTVARLAFSAVVLIVPTFLMGGTLPAAARSIVASDDAGRRGLAWLYGINTLGAVTGTLLATFFALEIFGNRLTLWSACGLNVLVAIAARMLARSQHGCPPVSESEFADARPASPPVFVLAASAIVGFAFLLMEVVWYRMLSPLLGGSTFTFGLILAVALLGIGLGGALYAATANRGGGTITAFAWTCALEALSLAVPFALGDRLAVLAAHLRSFSAVGFGPQVLSWALVIAMVVLPAAMVAGFQFPLLVALLGRGGAGIGRHVARTYALNTAGAIAGSLAGGFGLLPLLSAPGAWKFVVLLLALLALVALGFAGGNAGLFSRAGVFTTAGSAAALLLSLGPTAVWRHSGVGVGRSGLDAPSLNTLRERENDWRRQTVWEAEGVESSVAIAASHGASFVVNGKSDGNVRADAGTQVLGGLIGAALHGNVRRACVIGLGTGCTAGWLAKLPEIQRVDVMELEPAILHVARVCALANQDVLDNPNCRVLLGDARELLLTTRERYDLIFSEPSNPYRAGIASLFTTEFYETAHERLNPGGLFLQWVQAYEVDGDAIRMVLATLGAVFPHVETWTTQTGDLLLVASATPRVWNADALRMRLGREPFKTAMLRIWGVDSVEGFLAHFAAGARLAQQLAGLPNQPRNTDDNTLLEFAFARSVGRSQGFRTPELLHAAADIGAARPAIDGAVNWEGVGEERLAMFAYDKYPPPVPQTASELTRTRCEIRRLMLENVAAAAQLWLAHRPEPLNPRDSLTFAHALAEVGSEETAPFVERVHAFSPGEAAALAALFHHRHGRVVQARASLVAAFTAWRNDAWPTSSVQARAFELAAELAIEDKDSAAALFAALRVGPLPGYLMEAARGLTLTRLAACQTLNKRAEAYALFEPWPNWTRDFLKSRYAFYQSTGKGDAALARAQLAEFLAADTASFSRGLAASSK
jgi:spermidine synthase